MLFFIAREFFLHTLKLYLLKGAEVKRKAAVCGLSKIKNFKIPYFTNKTDLNDCI